MRMRRGHLFPETERRPVQKDMSPKGRRNTSARIVGVKLAERHVEGEAFRQFTSARAGGHGQGAKGLVP
jgi:hypothetical protein